MRKLLVLLIIAALTACSHVEVTDYSNAKPPLDIERFFSGDLKAYGVVKDRGGRVIRHFKADIVAHWVDGVGTLTEDFVFDDGEQQRRVWTLTADGNGLYTGTAGDVVGTATLQQAGNSLFLDYVLRLLYKRSEVDIRVDDRMYLVAPDVMINESSLSKFGLRVGSLTLVITRNPEGHK